MAAQTVSVVQAKASSRPARTIRVAAALSGLLTIAAPAPTRAGAQGVPPRVTPPAAERAVATPVVTPAPGSAALTALLDAVHRAVRTRARFRVHHVRTSGRWAFLHATEVVPLDGGAELQETDLDVLALLERRGDGAAARWTVVELWALPDEAERPRARFVARVRARQRVEGLPAALFPADL
ncbi:MAG: hypothetical protein WKG32_23615 [Gemmatimonadaceae bacterium]